MKIEKRENSDERRILLGMILDQGVLSKIATYWKDDLFRSPYSNTIARWCVSHYEKYGVPPREAIEQKFIAWSERTKNKGLVETIDKFLSGISNEYERDKEVINTQFVLDLSESYFNKVRLERLSDSIKGDISNGEIQEAVRRVHGFDKIDIGSTSSIKVLSDKQALREALNTNVEQLIKYPGAIGKFLGHELQRDSFISFLAPEKRGKTFWLMDFAWAALMQDRKVAVFQCGDLSQSQMVRRIATRAAGRPLGAKTIQKPISIKKLKKPGEDGLNVKVEFEEITYDKKMSVNAAWKCYQKLLKRRLQGEDDRLVLSTHPSDSISAAGIRAKLIEWDRQGWNPDVVVIDYADILAPPDRVYDIREQINSTWKRLRGISQEFHCLVLTATQADAASYNSTLIRKSNFSDDKRKLAHVTGLIGINQTDAEKVQDITRLNWVVLREREYAEHHVVHCAGCRSIGRIVMKSA